MKAADEADETCRVDVWLWRARLFKTRSLAAQIVETGRLRRTRLGVEQRLDKASRTVRTGDVLVFAVSGRVWTLRVAALGVRRGPPLEARALYVPLDGAGACEEAATPAPGDHQGPPRPHPPHRAQRNGEGDPGTGWRGRARARKTPHIGWTTSSRPTRT